MAIKKQHIEKQDNKVEEPVIAYSLRSSFRSVGNSKGVIIASKLIEASGIVGNDLVIEALEGAIVIRQLNPMEVNTNLSSWDKQFREAITKGVQADTDFFGGIKNEFDEKEW